MMRKKLHNVVEWIVLGGTLIVAWPSLLSNAQSPPPNQRQRPARPPMAPRPLKIEHLYWHFLVFQNHLDTKAAELDAQGKDGNMMRHYLQQKTGFSDMEFAAIRKSSARLTSEVKALDAQAVAVRAPGQSSSSLDQLRTLTLQRETNINTEVAVLRQALPPAKVKAFEAFLTQMFSPSNAVPVPHAALSTASRAAVQP